MNSSAKQIHIGWIYRRIGFLKRGMKKQIKPLAAILRFFDFSIPPTVISSAARNLPCTPRFLTPFTEGFPFSAITHTALYQCARKIPRLRSGCRCGSGVFPTYPLYGTWVIHPPDTVISNAVEKSSLHFVLSCSLRRRIPVFCYHTYDAIPVCEKDPSASLGMTIQE